MRAKITAYFFLPLLVIVFLSACAAPPLQTSQPTAVIPSPTTLTPEPPIPASDVPTVESPVASPTPAATATGAPEPTQTEVPAAWAAYIGMDGNVWMVNASSLEQVQITDDASGYSTGGVTTPVVVYQRPKWSSDGMLLAFERQDGETTESGFNYNFSLLVYDLASGENRPVAQGEQVIGFAWKPGTHLIAFSQAVDQSYFGGQGTDPAYAKGIRQLDADSGEVIVLVQAERGFHLLAPAWSPDGRFLSFQEVYLMEGNGKFAFYDFAAQRYVAWDEPIGAYSWSKDGETIVYDTLVYVAQGNEAIFTRPREGGEAQRISPEYDNGYAYSPVYSPGNEILAYLADLDGLEGNMVSLFVLETAGGKPRELGSFDNAAYLSWAGPDQILLAQGPYDNAEVLLVSVDDGSVTILAPGSQPAWNSASETH